MTDELQFGFLQWKNRHIHKWTNGLVGGGGGRSRQSFVFNGKWLILWQEEISSRSWLMVPYEPRGPLIFLEGVAKKFFASFRWWQFFWSARKIWAETCSWATNSWATSNCWVNSFLFECSSFGLSSPSSFRSALWRPWTSKIIYLAKSLLN